MKETCCVDSDVHHDIDMRVVNYARICQANGSFSRKGGFVEADKSNVKREVLKAMQISSRNDVILETDIFRWSRI